MPINNKKNNMETNYYERQLKREQLTKYNNTSQKTIL